MNRRWRKEQRLKRRIEWAGKQDEKQKAAFASADAAVDGIPPGQPILVGHHSERRHRKAIDRQDRAMRRGVEAGEMASKHRSVASMIQMQLDRSVFSDDPDAIERLEEKIAPLEAERDRAKEINAYMAKAMGGVRKRRLPWPWHDREKYEAGLKQAAKAIEAAREDINLTFGEKERLMAEIEFNNTVALSTTNLSSNISRLRKRLDAIRAEQESRT